jgi:hypothetical protein
MSDVLTLPLDPTGKATTNDITGEAQAIGTNPVRAFATNYGAFFASSLVLKDAATGDTLTAEQFFTAIVYDLPTAKYAAAVDDTIVGVVVITDPTVSANVVAAYQALGGGYTTPLTSLASDVNGYEPSTRPATWPNVIDSLATIPASEATHDQGQAGLITFEYVVHALDRLTQMAIMGDPISQDAVQAYANASESGALSTLNAQIALLNQHIANTNNPHQTTANQIGAMSTAQQDAAILAETTLRQNEDAVLTATLTQHETNYQNPHQVTLTQLGMYSVGQVNTNIANATTAINGTITTNTTVMNAHINNLNNPHDDSTTNLGTLTVSQIQSAITVATTPVSTSATTSSTTLSAHMANYNNPHVVTPAQIGTWTASALQSLENSLTSHITNYANPHRVNISQIAGMTVSQFNAALSAAETAMQNYYNSNYSVIVNHINNGNNPHQTNAEAIGALGPWNLGQLEADLNNTQTSINNSGHPCTEASMYLYDNWGSGSMSQNAGYGTIPDAAGAGTWSLDRWQGGNVTCGSGFPVAGPQGGTIVGFIRYGGWTTIFIENGSLDGVNYTSTLGENVTLSNADSYSFTNGNMGSGLYTGYGVATGVSQMSGASRSFTFNFKGGSGQGQPPNGYINDAAPPPPTGGGGCTHSISCFVAGTKVLMADYSWQHIETLVPGDLLMSPTGPAKMIRLHQAILGTGRNLLTMKEDPSTQWVADHPLWSKNKDGKQWWWSGDAPYMRAEVEQGLTAGLKDIYSVFEGEVEYAHLDGFVKRTPIVVEKADPNTPVYIPVLEGPPCIVNGYVAAAFFNEWEYDYAQLDWHKHHHAHRVGVNIARAEGVVYA